MNFTQFKNHVSIVIKEDEPNSILKEDLLTALINQYQDLEWSYGTKNEYVLHVWNKHWNNPEFQKQLTFVTLKV